MDLSLQDRILSQRNIENLTMDWNQDLHDPFLMKDMEKGVGKFVSHLQEGQKIMIVGDYDVDGITASALFHDLFLFLDKTEQMIARLPHRVEDGYGLSKKFIDEAVQQGCSLIVTVDNGISAYDEVVYANEKGIEVVITDHHMVPAQIPPAYATINPHQSDCQYPFSDLSGVAVAYKFCQAVLVALGIEENKRDYWLRWKSSLVALGTVADCMVLTGENRSLTHFGIKAINAGASVGISSLVKSAQGKYIKPVDAQGIGFGLAPRINAAGRLYNPNTAYDLLVASDKMQADVLAEQLHEMNAQRQLAVHVAMKEVEEMIDAEKSTLIVAASEKWSKGIVGLIAGRLSEKYNKPAIIFHDSQDGFLTASCRSIESYDIASALSVFEHLLAHYG
ncbi:MAG: DHH family phosphoesterase [Patescibacteria group bacterium]|nr:DHH family phosphoesterase [Patescibacteria group bacterium]